MAITLKEFVDKKTKVVIESRDNPEPVDPGVHHTLVSHGLKFHHTSKTDPEEHIYVHAVNHHIRANVKGKDWHSNLKNSNHKGSGAEDLHQHYSNTLKFHTLKKIINPLKEETLAEDIPSSNDPHKYPPPFLTMKREAIRIFPGGQKVAMYYIAKLDKHISIPFDSSYSDIPAISEDVSGPTRMQLQVAYDSHPGPTQRSKLNAVEKSHHVHDVQVNNTGDIVHFKHDDHAVHNEEDVVAPQDLGRERKPANDPKIVNRPHITPKHATGDFNDYHQIKQRAINEEPLEEAAKPKKKSKAKSKPKIKVKPYDFYNHLKDIAKGGEDKNKPLRFTSGERRKLQPEEAGLIVNVHKRMNLMNQAKAHKLMRSSKTGFNTFRSFALGHATVSK